MRFPNSRASNGSNATVESGQLRPVPLSEQQEVDIGDSGRRQSFHLRDRIVQQRYVVGDKGVIGV